MYTEAQKRASRKWNAKNMESMNLTLKMGLKDTWKGYAEQTGMSLTAFVTEAVEEKALHMGIKKEGAD